MNERGLVAFSRILDTWQEDGGLEIEMLEQTDERLFFNVTRCRYAEQYRELGMPQLGETLSCIRDAEVAHGFDPGIRLERRHTIMSGSSLCDFRFRWEPDDPDEA